MSVQVSYMGSRILNLTSDGTKKLTTKGKVCTDDITVQNTQDGGITPSGTININANGTYDVTDKANAVVDVPSDAPIDEAVTITQNGVTDVPTGKRYNPITVNVSPSENVKIWDITISEDQTEDTVMITDAWLASHYSDGGLAAIAMPTFTIQYAPACSCGGFRVNYSLNTVKKSATSSKTVSTTGFRWHHGGNSGVTNIGRIDDSILSDTATQSPYYGDIRLDSGGSIIMHCSASYPILAGTYRIIAWTISQ